MTAAILDFSCAKTLRESQPRGARIARARAQGSPQPQAPRLVCHWRRDVDGRLACVWEMPSYPQERRSRGF